MLAIVSLQLAALGAVKAIRAAFAAGEEYGWMILCQLLLLMTLLVSTAG